MKLSKARNEVVLYKSGNQGIDSTTLGALVGLGFLVFEASPLPHNPGPSPVAHFCGKGVAFGQEGIISFAEREDIADAQED